MNMLQRILASPVLSNVASLSLAVLGLLALSLARPVQAQDAAADRMTEKVLEDRLASEGDQLRSALRKLVGATQTLGDWKPHYENGVAIAERVYQRNNWTSEPDQFSLQVFREVGQHEPWALQQRWDTFMGMIEDRYDLSPDQSQRLRMQLIRDSADVFRRHAPQILEYSLEAIQTRATGGAITADQVSRWSKLAAPVMDDARKVMQATAEQFMQELSPEQQQRVRTDLMAAEERMERITQLREKWAAGQWEPADWGLDQDPIQLAAMQEMREEGIDAEAAVRNPGFAAEALKAERAALGNREPRDAAVPPAQASDAPLVAAKSAERSGAEVAPVIDASAAAGAIPGPADAPGAPQPVAGTPATRRLPDDAWGRYVQAFIRKYRLEEQQQQKAWLIYAESTKAAERVRMRLSDAQRGGAAREDLTRYHTQLDRQFQQMSRRLERLPTRAQRRDADPGDIPAPQNSAIAESGEAKSKP